MAQKIDQWKNYTIPLDSVIRNSQITKRQKRAIREIRRFFAKHARKNPEQIAIALEVNHAIMGKSRNIPRKIEVQAKELNGKLQVFLKGSKNALGMEKAEKEKRAEKQKEAKKVEEKKAESPATEKSADGKAGAEKAGAKGKETAEEKKKIEAEKTAKEAAGEKGAGKDSDGEKAK